MPTDKKQTAMSQYIDHLIVIRSATHNQKDYGIMSICIEEAKKFIEPEREQILEAFVAGDERGTKEIPFNCEQYYNQTFIS